MKTYLITVRATCLVDADSSEDAYARWEILQERDIEVDSEGGVHAIDLYDESEPVRGDKRWSQSAALDLIANIMSASEWNADTLDAIAEIVRSTGRAVDDLEQEP
jgi:hypothetical protein